MWWKIIETHIHIRRKFKRINLPSLLLIFILYKNKCTMKRDNKWKTGKDNKCLKNNKLFFILLPKRCKTSKCIIRLSNNLIKMKIIIAKYCWNGIAFIWFKVWMRIQEIPNLRFTWNYKRNKLFHGMNLFT